jgi:hypothetical protein
MERVITNKRLVQGYQPAPALASFIDEHAAIYMYLLVPTLTLLVTVRTVLARDRIKAINQDLECS